MWIHTSEIVTRCWFHSFFHRCYLKYNPSSSMPLMRSQRVRSDYKVCVYVLCLSHPPCTRSPPPTPKTARLQLMTNSIRRHRKLDVLMAIGGAQHSGAKRILAKSCSDDDERPATCSWPSVLLLLLCIHVRGVHVVACFDAFISDLGERPRWLKFIKRNAKGFLPGVFVRSLCVRKWFLWTIRGRFLAEFIERCSSSYRWVRAFIIR